MIGECTMVTLYLRIRAGDEIPIKFEHGKFGSVENLVAELSVTFHAKDLKVDITTY